MKRCEPTGKNSYSTRTHAIRAALRHSKKFGGSFRHYKCPWGDHWHLTTQVPKRLKGAAS